MFYSSREILDAIQRERQKSAAAGRRALAARRARRARRMQWREDETGRSEAASPHLTEVTIA